MRFFVLLASLFISPFILAETRPVQAPDPVLNPEQRCAQQVQEQRQVPRDVDDEVLPAAAHPGDRTPRERVERRVERLQRVDSGRERRSDLGAAQRRVEAAGRDLDLRQLGHIAESDSGASILSAAAVPP